MTLDTNHYSFILGTSPAVSGEHRGINFAFFSSQAEQVWLCLFDDKNNEQQFAMQRHQNIWYLKNIDIALGTKYGYRLAGEGCNPHKLMLDPYAKAVEGKPNWETEENRSWFSLNDQRDNAHLAPKALLVDTQFDWGNDRSPRTPWGETLIYELHIKGFTQLRQDLPEAIRGTYAGLAHPTMLNYLRELGITAVEMLPVQFGVNEPHLAEKGLQNYWNYNPAAMFAVEDRYWSGKAGSTPLSEFKTMVKALHSAGIEVILDVVFNHTAESEKNFPTLSQRGIDDQYYYWHDAQGHYLNATGCGNTLNLSRLQTRQWVVDCLRYWVEECHIDGFRFDLGTVLGRETPDFNPQAQLFAEIAQIESLRQCKFIAEPWDIGLGGYQLGQFPAYFAEWNGKFRDDIRRFWLWQSGELGSFAERLAGSSNLFYSEETKPHKSVNFITAHDGFTLRDLCSYNQKHNEANGENNRDGCNDNYSYNHGFEGVDSGQTAVENQRIFSATALLASLLFSNGTPMLLAGDEFGHTQYGNNNAYCQDNSTSWLKWERFNHQLFAQVRQLIALRKQIPSFTQDSWWTENNVTWLTPQGEAMSVADWHNHNSKALQVILNERWVLLVNAKMGVQTFSLPKGNWKVVFDSSSYEMQENMIKFNTMAFCILEGY